MKYTQGSGAEDQTGANIINYGVSPLKDDEFDPGAFQNVRGRYAARPAADDDDFEGCRCHIGMIAHKGGGSSSPNW